MFNIMNTAISGMYAQRRVLDITAHNVSNVSTPNFHRQRVELAADGVKTPGGLFSGETQGIGGVDVLGVTRARDELLEARLLRETGAEGGTQLARTLMGRIEDAFPEPSDDGIAALLDEMWAGFADLSNDPGSLASRSQLLERARSLTDAFQRADVRLDEVQFAAQDAVTRLAIDVNDVAAQIAQVNTSIAANPEAANDLLDRRDALMSDLARMTGARSVPSQSGQIDVYIGGRAIVSGSFAQTLDGSGGVLRWSSDGTDVEAPPSEAATLRTTIDSVVPSYRSQLDALANQLVTDVNALHAVGYDLDGNTGLNFFDPAGVTARTISLSADVDGQPRAIAAGAPVLPGPTAPGPNDGEQARALSLLAESATGPDETYRAFVADLGVEVRTAIRRHDIQTQVADTARAEVASVSSVSIDEEMSTMIQAQRAYEASARVLTTVDQMLEILMRTGVVGR